MMAERSPKKPGPLRLLLGVLALVAGLAAGCAGRHPVAKRPDAPAPVPVEPAPPTASPSAKPEPAEPAAASASRGGAGLVEEGIASWYGDPYHGRRASNGEIYDKHKMTAAHRTLPFESIVRVTNLKNGKQAEVRITDRGPFVEGRVIDLSLAAAREIDMVGAGTAPVRVELISGPRPTGQFTVQIGAFAEKANATRLRQSLERRYQPVFVHALPSEKGLLYRVRVGRLSTEAAAQRLAEKLRVNENIGKYFIMRLDE